MTYDGVRVFSATKARDRAVLGETVTAWLRAHPGVEVVDHVVRQSSDDAFHMLSITLFYRGEQPRRTRRNGGCGMSERPFDGCGDNSCVFEKPRGAGTNGGCQCLKAHDFDGRRRLMRIAIRLKAAEARCEGLMQWARDAASLIGAVSPDALVWCDPGGLADRLDELERKEQP